MITKENIDRLRIDQNDRCYECMDALDAIYRIITKDTNKRGDYAPLVNEKDDSLGLSFMECIDVVYTNIEKIMQETEAMHDEAVRIVAFSDRVAEITTFTKAIADSVERWRRVQFSVGEFVDEDKE